MSEFKDFASLGRLLQTATYAYSGKAAFGRGFSGFAAASKAGSALTRGLNDSGEALRDHFREKILKGGPGWAELSEWTQDERNAAGMTPDDPLHASGQMYEALAYEVDGLDAKVGIKDGVYHPEGDYGRAIQMEELFYLMEIGYTNNRGVRVEPRPIFSDSDFYGAANAVAEAFAETAIVNGLLKNLSRLV